MNLLLLLSAMLSAVMGIGSSARAPEAAATIAAKIEVARTSGQAVAPLSERPVQPIASIGGTALAPLAHSAFPTRAEPLYASRRRE